MVAALDELRSVLPALFEGEDYQVRRRAIDEQFRSGQDEAFEALNAKAQAQNIAVLRTPTACHRHAVGRAAARALAGSEPDAHRCRRPARVRLHDRRTGCVNAELVIGRST